MIRFTFTYLKPVAIFLIIVVLFQCCVAYNKTPVTIEQAINVDHKKVKRIKIDLAHGERLILDSIYYKGNDLYGQTIKKKVRDDYNEWEVSKLKAEVRIEEDSIIQIHLQNVQISRNQTAFLVIVLIPVTLGIIFLIGASSPNCQGYFCL